MAFIRSGSEAAFEVVYERYHRPLLSFSRHMLGNAEDAAEAVQQTFLSAYRDLRASGKEIQLRAWLFAIARNRCLSMLRARREHADVDVVEPATEGLAAVVERREDLRELLGDVSRLPEDQRAALVLAEIGALGHDEIGDVIGCSQEKVKALVFQARTSLAASRQARATSCEDIRMQLASLRGGALRRSGLRRHLRDCAGCREFGEEARRQRQAFAVILPVAPVAGLKDLVLSGAGISGGGAAATGVSGAAAGVGAFGAKGLAVKALVGAVIVGGGTAGGVVVAGAVDGGGQPQRSGAAAVSAHAPGVGSPSMTAQGVASTAATAAHLSSAARARGQSARAHANAVGRGQGSKRGRSGTQPAGRLHGAANGPKRAANEPSAKSEKTPPGNAYGHARTPASPTVPGPRTDSTLPNAPKRGTRGGAPAR